MFIDLLDGLYQPPIQQSDWSECYNHSTNTYMYVYIYQIYIPVISQSDYRIFAATYMYMYDLIIGTVFIQSKAHHS